ncbi:ornithine cyclodeaminase [Aquincola sp. S2]|uniref:Ornithine cyclodeaminase n=1 Tax=Pseudaquabacterium terrae TaxID=2732868 RepID=A0ABX2ELG8_9BURK|nr:ornithine cyclodeaminase [Aquabacterium terrae]NRF69499.1 ornithine cyclodeaminase [Aquabacterium terrae]
MTTLLSTHDIARIVAQRGLPETLKRLAAYIEADFRRWPEFDKTARVASHSDDGVIELMPIADASLYSFKYVNGHPKNTRSGLPTVMAFGVLADVATGTPELLSELTLTTAMRTAATSVMAARLLARPNSRTMALIGNGAQSEFQALAFHYLLGIDQIRLFDIDADATAKLLNNLAGVHGLRLIVCASTAEAVKGADIVTTVTADKTNATIITPEMIEPGMHINGVGGDCPGKTELHADVLRAGQVFVEYEPQSRIEGDLQQLPADHPVTELWRVLLREAPGRRSASDITVFDSVGFALEDYSALRFLRDSARELGLGTPIDLIPTMSDPKDLFGQLVPVTPRRPMLVAA